MKIGDTVNCVNSIDSTSLERSREYVIVDINPHGNIQVRQDFGNKETLVHYYKPNRFKLKATDENKINLHKTYTTRDGRKVRLFAISSDPIYPVVGEVVEKDGKSQNYTWTIDGFYMSSKETTNEDLIPQKQAVAVACRQASVTIFGDRSVLAQQGQISFAFTALEMERIVSAWNSMLDKGKA